MAESNNSPRLAKPFPKLLDDQPREETTDLVTIARVSGGLEMQKQEVGQWALNSR